MANKRGKEIDNTSLSLDHAEQRGFIHRDYLAHCLRWSHVVKFLMQQHRYKTAHLLDVGCGKEVPLAKLLYSSRMTHAGGSYTGVDYNELAWPSSIPQDVGKKFNMQLHSRADFAVDWENILSERKLKRADVLVCFEVLEHVEPLHSFQMLQAFGKACPKGDIFISTPCYDVKMGAADNHVNEMTYKALASLIHLAGLKIESVYGTFASQKDYKHDLDSPLWPGLREVWEALGNYYDSNVLACMFAPLFPTRARNCLWHLKMDKVRQLPPAEVKELLNPELPHSSSDRWVRDMKQILKEVKL